MCLECAHQFQNVLLLRYNTVLLGPYVEIDLKAYAEISIYFLDKADTSTGV